MKKYLVLFLVVLFSAGIFADENVKTSDVNVIKSIKDAVAIWDSKLDIEYEKYCNRLKLYIHYQNFTEKKIIAIEVYIKIADSFNNGLLRDITQDEVILKPKEKKKSNAFITFDCNTFGDDSADRFNRICILAENGTAKITFKISKVIFEDGTVLKAKECDGPDGMIKCLE